MIGGAYKWIKYDDLSGFVQISRFCWIKFGHNLGQMRIIILGITKALKDNPDKYEIHNTIF